MLNLQEPVCSLERGGSQEDLEENSPVKTEGQVWLLISPVMSFINGESSCFTFFFSKNIFDADEANISLCPLISDSNNWMVYCF